MAIWNKKSQSQQVLQESSKQSQLDFSALSQLPYYNFISSLSLFRLGTYTNLSSEIKKSMLEDPIISMIINMWISDALHKDVITHDVFTVDIEALNKEKDFTDQLNEINEYVDYLINNSNILDILPQVLYNVITDGITSVRFGFIDSYEDTKIKLFESKTKRSKEKLNEAADSVDRALEKITRLDEADKLTEATDFSDYEEQSSSEKKVKRLSGRYYFSILPEDIVPLKNKGITVFYMDLSNHSKILNPKNITTFINNRGNVKTLSVKSNPDDLQSDIYELPLGKSFIDNAVTPWSMLNTVEDCTLLALLTRSSIYRLFQIDVGAMGTKETDNLILEFKKRLTARETVDVRKDYYSSAQTQIPLGDSIIIPTRNGIGAINVQSIGGDLDIKTSEPLDYFREKVLGALGVPKQLVYGDESGQLINTSAARQDVRYLRTIQQFTSILSAGLEDIIADYLDCIGVDLSKIDITVNFAEVNNQDALDRIEFEQSKQEALDRAITSLNNLGITFDDGAYTETRNLLIKRYLDSELLDVITSDENNGDTAMNGPEEKGKETLPGGSSFGAPRDINIDVNNEEGGEGSGTIEDIENMEVSQEDMTLPSAPSVEEPSDITPNARPPYSIS